MPRWSSAHSVETSNFAKVFSPVSTALMGIYFNIEDAILNNVVNYIPSECDTTIYTMINKYDDEIITGSFGTIYKLGEANTSQLSDAPISGIILNDEFIFDNYFQYIHTDYTSVVSQLFINSNVLYIKHNDTFSELEYPITVKLSGITEYNIYITEEISINGPYVYATDASFKLLHKVECKYSLAISNHIDLSEDHNYAIPNVNKKIFTRAGELFDPIIEYADTSLVLNYFNGDSIVDEYLFQTIELDYLFLSAVNDVIGYANNQLYAGKLHIPVELNLNVNSSYNNNQFIYADQTTSIVGDNIRFVVNLENIREIFGDEYIQIVIEHDGDKTFIKQDITGSSDDNTWINQIALGNQIAFSLSVADEKPIVVKVYINNYDEYMCAGTYVAQVHYRIFPIEVSGSEKQLIIYNNKLCILTNTSTSECPIFDNKPLYRSVNFIRDAFTVDSNNIYTQFDFGLLWKRYI